MSGSSRRDVPVCGLAAAARGQRAARSRSGRTYGCHPQGVLILTQTDISHLAAWIGKTEQARDSVTPGLVERFRATFGSSLAESADAPPGVHWCLAPAA